MIIAGVDCGIRGGLAIVIVEDGAAPRLVHAIDVPVVGASTRTWAYDEASDPTPTLEATLIARAQQ
jgi:hypothetical protein